MRQDPCVRLPSASVPPVLPLEEQRKPDLERCVGASCSHPPGVTEVLATLPLWGRASDLTILGLILHAQYQSVPAGSSHRRRRWHKYGRRGRKWAGAQGTKTQEVAVRSWVPHMGVT